MLVLLGTVCSLDSKELLKKNLQPKNFFFNHISIVSSFYKVLYVFLKVTVHFCGKFIIDY